MAAAVVAVALGCNRNPVPSPNPNSNSNQGVVCTVDSRSDQGANERSDAAGPHGQAYAWG